MNKERTDLVATFLESYQLTAAEVFSPYSLCSVLRTAIICSYTFWVLQLYRKSRYLVARNHEQFSQGVFIFQVDALREGEVNEVFFEALAHVKEIHNNCKV